MSNSQIVEQVIYLLEHDAKNWSLGITGGILWHTSGITVGMTNKTALLLNFDLTAQERASLTKAAYPVYKPLRKIYDNNEKQDFLNRLAEARRMLNWSVDADPFAQVDRKILTTKPKFSLFAWLKKVFGNA